MEEENKKRESFTDANRLDTPKKINIIENVLKEYDFNEQVRDEE